MEQTLSFRSGNKISLFPMFLLLQLLDFKLILNFLLLNFVLDLLDFFFYLIEGFSAFVELLVFGLDDFLLIEFECRDFFILFSNNVVNVSNHFKRFLESFELRIGR
jgi:hypothetical protein